MHTPILYKWSHKLHHLYKEPVGMESLYLHWFDLYVGNIIPIYLPIVNTNLNTHIIWTMIIITSTILSHTEILDTFHNEHHRLFNCNFGISFYMDKIFDTYKYPTIKND